MKRLRTPYNILIVSNSTWNIYNFRLPVIRMLLGLGYRVIVLAPVDEFVSMLAQEKGIEIVPLKSLNRDSMHIWNNLKLFAEFWRLYGIYRPDLILHFTIKPNIFGNLAAALRGISSVCVLTGLGYTFLHDGWLQRITAWLYTFSFRFARKVGFENQLDCDVLVNKKIIPRDKTFVVNGCGVDMDYFHANGLQPQAGKIVFTFVGRLLADKGIYEFVEAAKQVKMRFPNAEFWVLGGLDPNNPAQVDRSDLLQWVQSGIVQYKGVTADVRPFIGRSDWIVLPSYREGLSRVLLEAMAMSKPLITSDTAGCRETVEEGKNGFLVPVKDAGALALVMEKCCTLSPETTKRMGAYGREKAEKEFESSQVGAAYLKIVQEILN